MNISRRQLHGGRAVAQRTLMSHPFKIAAFLAPGPVSGPGHLSATTLTRVLFRHSSTKEIMAGYPWPFGTLSDARVVPAPACHGEWAASKLGWHLAPGPRCVTSS